MTVITIAIVFALRWGEHARAKDLGSPRLPKQSLPEAGQADLIPPLVPLSALADADIEIMEDPVDCVERGI